MKRIIPKDAVRTRVHTQVYADDILMPPCFKGTVFPVIKILVAFVCARGVLNFIYLWDMNRYFDNALATLYLLGKMTGDERFNAKKKVFFCLINFMHDELLKTNIKNI